MATDIIYMDSSGFLSDCNDATDDHGSPHQNHSSPETNTPSTVERRNNQALARSLAMVIRCSQSVMENNLPSFQHELVQSLQNITQMASVWRGDETIRQLAVRSATHTIGWVHKHVPKGTKDFLEMLLSILRTPRTPNDVRIQAVDTISKFMDCENVPPDVVAMVNANASSLISSLSTASMTHPESGDDSTDKSMLVLYRLASISEVLRSKMARRRCTILAVARDLCHENHTLREKALGFIPFFLEHIRKHGCFVEGDAMNLDIVRDALVDSIHEETQTELQVRRITLLQDMLSLYAFETTEILECLRTLDYGSPNDSVIVAAATSYCHGVQQPSFHHHNELWAVVDLTTFPYAKVRAEALQTLKSLLSNTDSSGILLEDTDMLENFSLILRYGSSVDRTAATNIARLLARSSVHHSILCNHQEFIEALVDMVVGEGCTGDDEAHLYGVETLLSLLRNEDNISAFLSDRRLMPWLVNFVSFSALDDDFKEDVVSLVVRLSLAHVEAA